MFPKQKPLNISNTVIFSDFIKILIIQNLLTINFQQIFDNNVLIDWVSEYKSALHQSELISFNSLFYSKC